MERENPGDLPRCVVIVVSFQSVAEIGPCLEAIQSQRDVDCTTYVVDNASTDGSADLVRRRFPAVHLVVNTQNVGFARANNQILETVDAPAYALINPDTVIPADALRQCLDLFREEPDVGVVGARLLYPDGKDQPSAHAFLSLRNLFEETFLLWRLGGNNTPGALGVPGFRPDRRMDVDWVRGAFFVVRGEARRQAGAFDPDFFMYGEEMEWCFRIREKGWRVVYLPRIRVMHVEGASSRPVAGPMFVENLKGRLRFLRKHRSPSTMALARALLATSVGMRYVARLALSTGRRVFGRPPTDDQERKLEMFRAAYRWLRQGMPS